VVILLIAIGGYSINGYWWLLVAILLMAISDYSIGGSINGYWWLFYY
jgi:hypothetical protein